MRRTPWRPRAATRAVHTRRPGHSWNRFAPTADRFVLLAGLGPVDAWNTLLTLLREQAPINAADITPPLDPARRSELLRTFPVMTPELEQWFALHDGQVPSALTDDAGRVRSASGPFPRGSRMLSLDEVVVSWQLLNARRWPSGPGCRS